ncbi:MAG: hypothetical protein ACJ8J0_16260 [Longimicrobiaceae bacterium]
MTAAWQRCGVAVAAAATIAAASLLSLAACSEWTARPLPQPGTRSSRIVGKPIRVTRAGGEVLDLSEAEVRGDSLYGTREDFVLDPYVTLPLPDVARLETKGTSYSGPVVVGLVGLPSLGAVFWRYVVLPAVYD